MSSETPDRARQAGRALDAANFFLADVRDGLGPYLAVYLLTEQHWDEARIGLVMSVATIAGIVAQTPAGALVDATHAKRLVMVIAAIMVTLASLSLPLFPSFLPVAISQGIAQAAAVIFPPAIAAVSLGIFGHAAFTRRIGRNETFNHAGNAVAAALAGVSAYWFGPTVVFYLHKRFFLAALLILPIRGALYTLSDNPFWLVGVQLLDGVGAGIFGAIFPVIVADLMRNTGRFNVAQGAVITAQSIGAALSTTLAGFVVVGAGYSAAFISLGLVAAIGAAICICALPETRHGAARRQGETAAPASAIAAE
ncbi:MFS transporter [Bradyrhizobium diazoefficiens]|nr:MFS transporter [Bradyrhizobium diazoefficiens]MBR0703305.1 MFS transporter [Bradyrhizobium diazoefficiens]MBR0772061.1 MFS transporter [Bradyrhizobium diazoefficiens]